MVQDAFAVGLKLPCSEAGYGGGSTAARVIVCPLRLVASAAFRLASIC